MITPVRKRYVMKNLVRSVTRRGTRWSGAMAALLLGLSAPAALHAQAAPADRLKVLFLGDDALHRPYERAKEILPVLANNGIDMFYTDDVSDLNKENLDRYHALIFYNNQSTLPPA